jgi:hypothetical protein
MTNSATYTIRLMGHLGPTWSDWFDGMAITNLADGETELVGELADEAALHGVLVKIRDLGLPILCLQRSGTQKRQHRQTND